MLAESAFTSEMKEPPLVCSPQQPSSEGKGLSPTAISASSTPQVGGATELQPTSEGCVIGLRNPRERDSSWLELEVCREHLRHTCPRHAEECRYAHPEPRIYVKDGRVTCCYDFLKDRCYRERCRYFHPPVHIKERLVSAGKQFGAMMSNFHMATGSLNSPAGAVPLTPVIYGPDGRIMSAAPPGFIPGPVYGSENERIDICPFFVQGKCNNSLCPMVHPEPHVRLNLDSTVTLCRDFIRGSCARDKCRYFHPPGNMLEPGAMPALMQQGIMVASPVMPVYPPVMYPMRGPVTTLPSPVASGVPLYPSLPVPAGVPMPLVLASPPPPMNMKGHNQQTPISTVASNQALNDALPPEQNFTMTPVPYQH